jgi:hypothetical protein
MKKKERKDNQLFVFVVVVVVLKWVMHFVVRVECKYNKALLIV